MSDSKTAPVAAAVRAVARVLAGLALLLGPACAQAADGCADLQPEAVLQHVNAARALGSTCGARSAAGPKPPLRWSPPLQALAERQARWLAELGRLAHTGPNGESLRQRAEGAGYDYARIAENVARGQRSVPQVLDGWTASEGHCVNLYDPLVTEMALACVAGSDGRPVWALLLARPAPREAAGPVR